MDPETVNELTKPEVLAEIEAIKLRDAAGHPVSDDKRPTADYLAH